MQLKYVRELGAGASADVWLAEDAELRRFVAVKFFRTVDLASHRRLAVEHAKALVRVRHPAIVTVYAVEPQTHPESGTACLAIIMEYIDAPTLAAYEEPINVSSARELVRELADGVDAIHAAGLVHDDLHEENVLLSASGPKILDILYTRSLQQISSSAAHANRSADIRSYAQLVHRVLEKQGHIDRDRLEKAHLRASQVSSCRDAAKEFLRALETSSTSSEGSTSTTPEHFGIPEEAVLYLVWRVAQAMGHYTTVHMGTASVFTQAQQVAELPVGLHATDEHIWRYRDCQRPIHLLREDVLQRWWSEGPDFTRAPEDYTLETIADATLVSLADLVEVPLCSEEPARLARYDVFEFERSLHVLGTIGPYVLAKQHDYTFGGGAHGFREARFLTTDLSKFALLESAEAVFMPDASDRLELHRELARSIFMLRDDVIIMEGDQVKLAAVRPYMLEAGSGDRGLMLQFCTGASYIGSDHRWSSYSVSEDVRLRGDIPSLTPHLTAPSQLRSALLSKSVQHRVVGWSAVTPHHPARSSLLEAIVSGTLAG